MELKSISKSGPFIAGLTIELSNGELDAIREFVTLNRSKFAHFISKDNADQKQTKAGEAFRQSLNLLARLVPSDDVSKAESIRNALFGELKVVGKIDLDGTQEWTNNFVF